MKKQFKLLVFDWDGTLSDSSSIIVLALQEACKQLGLPIPSREAVMNIIGLGLREGLFEAVPTLTEAQFAPLCDAYRRYYFAMDDEIVLYDGVIDGLTSLQQAGYGLAVATGKSRVGLDRALEKLKLTSFFEMTRCADESASKPSPDMLLEIMSPLEVAPEETLMIGDTTHDLQMAINAKIASVGMTYGAHPKSLLQELKPLALFDHFPDLVDWIVK